MAPAGGDGGGSGGSGGGSGGSGGGGEVTEAALAARQDDGVASFAEFYAAVLLGILVEHDAALRHARARRRYGDRGQDTVGIRVGAR